MIASTDPSILADVAGVTDERVGELYRTIQGELGETIVVVTADHGELFGEDDMLAHKYSMHNAVLNVPMVVQGLPGLSDDGIVQHSDVVRTVLEVAGAETDTIQGVDLREERPSTRSVSRRLDRSNRCWRSIRSSTARSFRRTRTRCCRTSSTST